MVRRWCEKQPWAQLDEKARARARKQRAKAKPSSAAKQSPEGELQPWVEHMLTSLSTQGLERDELSLDAYTLVIPCSGCMVCVFIARADDA